jgi:ribosomal RNA-processing protein 1
LRAFWITIGREFHSIDRLRLDKYLLLIRSYVGVALQIFLKDKSTSTQANGDASTKKRKREESAKDKKRSKSKSKKNGKRNAQEDEDEQTPTEPQTQSSSDGNGDAWTDLKTYLDIISEGPLNPLNFDPNQPTLDEKNGIIPMPHGPDGLRYHILDLWIDELEKVLEFDDEGKPVCEVPIDLLLAPVERLKKEGLHKPVRTRAAETLGDERLVQWGLREGVVVSKDEAEEEESSEEEWGGFGDD